MSPAKYLGAFPWHCTGGYPIEQCHTGNPCSDGCRPRPPAPPAPTDQENER